MPRGKVQNGRCDAAACLVTSLTLITIPTGLHVKNGQIVRQAWGSCYYKESSFQTPEDMYIAAKDERGCEPNESQVIGMRALFAISHDL